MTLNPGRRRPLTSAQDPPNGAAVTDRPAIGPGFRRRAAAAVLVATGLALVIVVVPGREWTVAVTDPEESQSGVEPWTQWVTVHTGVSRQEHGIEKPVTRRDVAMQVLRERRGQRGLFYRSDTTKSGFHHPDGLWWIRTGRHQVIDEPVSPRRIAPTVLAVLGLEAPQTMKTSPLDGFAITR